MWDAVRSYIVGINLLVFGMALDVSIIFITLPLNRYFSMFRRAARYGDTAEECGEAFFLCGKSLLELARFVDSVCVVAVLHQ